MTIFHLGKKNNSLDFLIVIPNIIIKQTVEPTRFISSGLYLVIM